MDVVRFVGWMIWVGNMEEHNASPKTHQKQPHPVFFLSYQHYWINPSPTPGSGRPYNRDKRIKWLGSTWIHRATEPVLETGTGSFQFLSPPGWLYSLLRNNCPILNGMVCVPTDELEPLYVAASHLIHDASAVACLHWFLFWPEDYFEKVFNLYVLVIYKVADRPHPWLNGINTLVLLA